jgi:hypothetical protein
MGTRSVVHSTYLIAAQSPEATLVNSYTRWQRLGRQVRKGEKGIAIFVPYKRTEPDPETGLLVETVTGFGLGHVWDVRQTDGEPLPAPPPIAEDTSSSGIARAVNRRLSRWLIGEGLPCKRRDRSGPADGQTSVEQWAILPVSPTTSLDRARRRW